MKSESIAYVVAGMAFGVILGWVIGTQQATRAGAPPAQTSAPAAQSQTSGTNQRQPPVLDERRVQELTTTITSNPKDAAPVVELADVYFKAERWQDAIEWYRRALALNPKDADASTHLGEAYFYTNQTDQALAQFDRSLAISPRHTETLLKKGMVLAFGKEDLKAAAEEWKKVVEIAPNSREGEAARRALEGIATAHAGGAGPASSNQ